VVRRALSSGVGGTRPRARSRFGDGCAPRLLHSAEHHCCRHATSAAASATALSAASASSAARLAATAFAACAVVQAVGVQLPATSAIAATASYHPAAHVTRPLAAIAAIATAFASRLLLPAVRPWRLLGARLLR